MSWDVFMCVCMCVREQVKILTEQLCKLRTQNPVPQATPVPSQQTAAAASSQARLHGLRVPIGSTVAVPAIPNCVAAASGQKPTAAATAGVAAGTSTDQLRRTSSLVSDASLDHTSTDSPPVTASMTLQRASEPTPGSKGSGSGGGSMTDMLPRPSSLGALTTAAAASMLGGHAAPPSNVPLAQPLPGLGLGLRLGRSDSGLGLAIPGPDGVGCVDPLSSPSAPLLCSSSGLQQMGVAGAPPAASLAPPAPGLNTLAMRPARAPLHSHSAPGFGATGLAPSYSTLARTLSACESRHVGAPSAPGHTVAAGQALVTAPVTASIRAPVTAPGLSVSVGTSPPPYPAAVSLPLSAQSNLQGQVRFCEPMQTHAATWDAEQRHDDAHTLRVIEDTRKDAAAWLTGYAASKRQTPPPAPSALQQGLTSLGRASSGPLPAGIASAPLRPAPPARAPPQRFLSLRNMGSALGQLPLTLIPPLAHGPCMDTAPSPNLQSLQGSSTHNAGQGSVLSCVTAEGSVAAAGYPVRPRSQLLGLAHQQQSAQQGQSGMSAELGTASAAGLGLGHAPEWS